MRLLSHCAIIDVYSGRTRDALLREITPLTRRFYKGDMCVPLLNLKVSHQCLVVVLRREASIHQVAFIWGQCCKSWMDEIKCGPRFDFRRERTSIDI